jgi:hypothetical protein
MSTPDYFDKLYTIKILRIGRQFSSGYYDFRGEFEGIYSPNTPLKAECQIKSHPKSSFGVDVNAWVGINTNWSRIIANKNGYEYKKQSHTAPGDTCVCGLYSHLIDNLSISCEALAVKHDIRYDINRLINHDTKEVIRVYLPCLMSNWGEIHVHENGIRAEYSQIERVILQQDFWEKGGGNRLQTLDAIKRKGYQTISSGEKIASFLENKLTTV